MSADCERDQHLQSWQRMDLGAYLHNTVQHISKEKLHVEPISLASISVQLRQCHQNVVIWRLI